MPTITPQDTTAPIQIATTEPKVEVKAPEPSQPKPEEIQSQEKMAKAKNMEAFARREKALRAKMRQIDELTRDYKAKEESFKARQAEFDQYKAIAEKLSDPRQLLDLANEKGLTTEQLTQAMLDPSRLTDQNIQMLRREIQALKTAQEQANEKSTKAQKDAYDNALKQISNETKILVKSDPETYEFINAMGAENAVVEYIRATFDEDGVLPSIEDACQAVENHLYEETVKAMDLKKVKSKLSTPKETPQEPKVQPTPKAEPKQPVQGLTHAKLQDGQSRKFTVQERIKRAKLIAAGINPDVG